MSTESNADLIATVQIITLGARAAYAIAALVFFEHLITFRYEVDLVWRRKWSAATWIFVFNRYLLLTYALSSIEPAVPQICNDPQLQNTLFFLTAGQLPVIPIEAFTILRTFALLREHSWRPVVTWTLIVSTLVAVTLTSYRGFSATWIYVDDPILGSLCQQIGYTQSLGIMNCVNTVASVASIISASIVLVTTLMATARQVQQSSILKLKTTLSEVLLRDGSLFFLIDLVLGVLSVITTSIPLNGTAIYVTTTVLNIVPQLFLSRFIINLRQVGSPGTSTNQHTSRFSIPDLRMPTMDDVIGNLGEPLDLEYRLDDDGDVQDGRTSANGNMELEDAAGTMSWATGAADVEAAGPSGSGSGSADADVLDIDGIGLEELRLSPTLSV